MKVAERNRLIKKVLKKEFENVKVVGSRGTAYGWVKIDIEVQKPHKGLCRTENPYVFLCSECLDVKGEAEKNVWDILGKEGLIKHLGTYYSDGPIPDKRYEIIINVNLKEA